jgi:hypothetical protein
MRDALKLSVRVLLAASMPEQHDRNAIMISKDWGRQQLKTPRAAGPRGVEDWR